MKNHWGKDEIFNEERDNYTFGKLLINFRFSFYVYRYACIYVCVHICAEEGIKSTGTGATVSCEES